MANHLKRAPKEEQLQERTSYTLWRSIDARSECHGRYRTVGWPLVPIMGTRYKKSMRIIARSVLVAFGARHPEAKAALGHWERIVKAAKWPTMNDVQGAFPKAKALNGERVRFEIAGGNYRLVVAFDFGRQIAFIKFVGTHADYDKIDALTVSMF